MERDTLQMNGTRHAARASIEIVDVGVTMMLIPEMLTISFDSEVGAKQ